MSGMGSQAERRLLGNEPAIAAIRRLSKAVSVADSEPVVRVRDNECLLLTEAAD